MNRKASANVIPFTTKPGENGTMSENAAPHSETRVIAITSGKGGVGKTNIVANLGHALAMIGKKVLILDADWGLGNLDVLLGLAPRYNLSHVITGEKTVAEIILDGPGSIQILPAASGIQELTNLTFDQKLQVLNQLDLLLDTVDVLLIDTAAGISSNVMDFNVSAQEILVVVAPEPTSVTDAYALMKVLSVRYGQNHCKLLVNQAANVQEAHEIHRQLNLVVERFLNFSLEYVGCVFYDEKVPLCVKRQKIICDQYPGAKASRCYTSLAQKIASSEAMRPAQCESNFFWSHLCRSKLA
jgi:flagellar biosynthesis protein FlhG